MHKLRAFNQAAADDCAFSDGAFKLRHQTVSTSDVLRANAHTHTHTRRQSRSSGLQPLASSALHVHQDAATPVLFLDAS